MSQMYLANHGREHMAAFQIEVVIRTIEVGRHYGDVIRAILQVETLAHFQSGNLGNGVRFVGIFQRRGEEHFFFHGLFGITRIDAGASQEEEFLHIVAKTFTDDVLLYLQVFVDEVGTVNAVCHDAANESSGKEYIFRLFFIKEFTYGNGIQQIELFVGFANEIGISFILQVFPDGGAYQTTVSGYVDFGVLV